MGLLSFFKRTPSDSGATRRTRDDDELTRQARTRARQRLIGALVLVVLGVLILPLLFDKEPRPLSTKTELDVVDPGRVNAPGQRSSGKVIEETAADAGVAVRPAKVPASSPATVVAPVPVPEVQTAPAQADKRASSDGAKPVAETPTPVARKAEPSPKSTEADKREADKREAAAHAKAKAAQESARAKDLLEGKEPSSKPAADGVRFVVQIGAFADGAAAAEARSKAEKLGIKTYTQQVETASGKRVRVRIGPFAERGQAEKMLARIKSAGLSGAVLTL